MRRGEARAQRADAARADDGKPYGFAFDDAPFACRFGMDRL
jgi:hypothetical protein